MQTKRKCTVLDVEMLEAGELPPSIENGSGEIVMLDSVSPSHMLRVGNLLWENRGTGLFAIGAQGVEYALVRHWISAGLLAATDPPPSAGKCERMVVVSGSVSQVTAGQIQWALKNGFEAVRVNPEAVLNGEDDRQKEVDRAIKAALEILENGRDPLIFSATGPDDPAVGRFNAAVKKTKTALDQANHRVGKTLGAILERVLRRTGVNRAVISGGDTSGHATRQLGIYALTALASTMPGAALFEAHSEQPDFQGLQLALKGGQMGTIDFFGWIKNGGGAAGRKG